ncbi:hypothetical protein CFI11_19745 [Thalassococcus sp. S3]|nr:hypothetical protein CFI11_19745 [Thalassococcus sp. S3]
MLLAITGRNAAPARLNERSILLQIPKRTSCKMRVGVDQDIYRLRNMVERCFNKLKNARRVTTRDDKAAESDLGLIDVASVSLWVRHLFT